jgi:hypothetical protein
MKKSGVRPLCLEDSASPLGTFLTTEGSIRGEGRKVE